MIIDKHNPLSVYPPILSVLIVYLIPFFMLLLFPFFVRTPDWLRSFSAHVQLDSAYYWYFLIS